MSEQQTDATGDWTVLLPASWPRPSGYSNGIAARGRQIFLAGQIGWDSAGRYHSSQLAQQVKQALENIVILLAEAGAGPEHLVRLTWYITSRAEYLHEIREIGAVYREVLGKNFPVMSVVQVAGLVEELAKVEIEATAVVPE